MPPSARPSLVVALALATALLLALALPGSARALDIVTCGQDVPTGETGTLTADLVCPTTSGYGVFLSPKSTLELAGHSITGGVISVYIPGGKGITIEGPGEIAGGEVGVFATNNTGKVGVTIRDGVVLHDHTESVIALGQGNKVKLVLDDVTIRDNPGSAVGDCNGLGIKGTDVTITRNGTGICGDKIKLLRATITDNDVAGIFSWTARVKLRDSTVTGNNTDGDNYDIATFKRPGVRNTTCDRSVQLPPFPGHADPGSPTWDVCGNDW